MSEPRYPTQQYLAGEFVISAGSLLFRRTASEGLEICLVHQRTRNEWLLPKGRKDERERVEDAALRETYEETGWPCKLWPMTITTRAPPPPGVAISPSEAYIPRQSPNCIEPIAITIRTLPAGGIKLIYWFITTVTGEDKVEGTQMANEDFESHFMSIPQALERLTFQCDRQLVQKAIDIVSTSSSD